MSELAPIVLFVYNRPWHTRKTLEALSRNTLADQSQLFVFSDGPKENANENDLQMINEVRTLVTEKDWCKSLVLLESTKNKGLATSIIEGVTSIVNEYGKIIVLEDDIITSVGFLKYMNEALLLYEQDDKVMHISGYMYPLEIVPETFFTKTTSCWGWSTWASSWSFFEKNAKKQIPLLSEKWKEFTYDFSCNSFKDQLEKNLEGKIDTWAIFWYASVFLNGGLALHPYPSLVQNIGFDGTGLNCGIINNTDNPYHWNSLTENINVKRIKIKNNKIIYFKLKKYFRSMNKAKLTIRDKQYLIRKVILNYIKNISNVIFFPNKIQIISKNKENKLTYERYIDGETILMDKKIYYNDFMSYEFIKNEMFNLEIYKFNTEQDEPYILDCGSNIGLSIIYFKLKYPNAKVIGFEPDPKVFKTLQKNIESFNLDNVDLIDKALWTEEGKIKFLIEGADGGRAAINSDVSDNFIELNTTILSKYIDREVDFLKIDIEGAEYNVLNECKDKLHLVNNIFIEYHSFSKENQNLNDILKILSENGFRYYISSIGVNSANPFIKIVESLGMDNQLNISAIKIR